MLQICCPIGGRPFGIFLSAADVDKNLQALNAQQTNNRGRLPLVQQMNVPLLTNNPQIFNQNPSQFTSQSSRPLLPSRINTPSSPSVPANQQFQSFIPRPEPFKPQPFNPQPFPSTTNRRLFSRHERGSGHPHEYDFDDDDDDCDHTDHHGSQDKDYKIYFRPNYNHHPEYVDYQMKPHYHPMHYLPPAHGSFDNHKQMEEDHKIYFGHNPSNMHNHPEHISHNQHLYTMVNTKPNQESFNHHHHPSIIQQHPVNLYNPIVQPYPINQQAPNMQTFQNNQQFSLNQNNNNNNNQQRPNNQNNPTNVQSVRPTNNQQSFNNNQQSPSDRNQPSNFQSFLSSQQSLGNNQTSPTDRNQQSTQSQNGSIANQPLIREDPNDPNYIYIGNMRIKVINPEPSYEGKKHFIIYK